MNKTDLITEEIPAGVKLEEIEKAVEDTPVKQKKKTKRKTKKKEQQKEINPFELDGEIIVNTLNQIKLQKKGEQINQTYAMMFIQSYSQVMEKYGISTTTKPELAMIVASGLLISDVLTEEEKKNFITEAKIKLYNGWKKIKKIFKFKKGYKNEE